MDGLTDGLTDGWIDGWMDKLCTFSRIFSVYVRHEEVEGMDG